jgi:16S rRNA (cytosine967-C5)-methyltransferase
LAFAADMANQGRLVAADADRGRLSRIGPRAQRAGATNIECRLINPRQELKALADIVGKADLVLVDAPCSGSGTWRRNPETRWRLRPERLKQIVAVQAHLLDVAAQLVRPGGRLVYAVCSLLGAEGRAQADAFAQRRSSFISEVPPITAGRVCGDGRLLTPGHDGTDGFFIARWQAAC